MPRERKPRVIVRLLVDAPPELVQRLDRYCEVAGRTRREVIIEALDGYLDRRNATTEGAWPV